MGVNCVLGPFFGAQISPPGPQRLMWIQIIVMMILGRSPLAAKLNCRRPFVCLCCRRPPCTTCTKSNRKSSKPSHRRALLRGSKQPQALDVVDVDPDHYDDDFG